MTVTTTSNNNSGAYIGTTTPIKGHHVQITLASVSSLVICGLLRFTVTHIVYIILISVFSFVVDMHLNTNLCGGQIWSEGTGSGAAVTGGHELPDVSAGNRTQILSKSSRGS